MRSIVPNGLTLFNLFFGCLAIIFLFEDKPVAVFICLMLSNVADFFDGWAARALGVSGDLGKELDSLADVVSFGLVPGFIMYFMLQESCDFFPYGICQWPYLPYLGFAITLSSAYRLAKFNLLESNPNGFVGLPTPANTLFFLGYYMLAKGDWEFLKPNIFNPIGLVVVVLIFSYLLNAPFEMFKLKLSIQDWKKNWQQWLLILLSIPLIIVFREGSPSIIIVLYILLSLSRLIHKKDS